jgi:hypothetical protein
MSRLLCCAFSTLVASPLLASAGCGGADTRGRDAAQVAGRGDALADSAWTAAAQAWDDLCVQMGTVADLRISACISGYPARPARRASICDGVSASVLAGRIAFVAAEAAACLDRIRAMSCDVLLAALVEDDFLPGLCPAVLQGQSGVDGVCTDSYDCADPASLACHLTSSCNGVCRPRGGLGEPCGSSECARGSTCSASGCLRVAEEGEACGSKVAECHPLLLCDPTGICVKPVVGYPCMAGGWENMFSCGLFLTCKTDVLPGAGASAGTCAAFANLGESCTPGSADCGWGRYCVPADGGGECATQGRLGEVCGPVLDGAAILATKDCLEGYCDRRPGELGGHCQPFRALGERCVRDVECDNAAGRHCRAGACQSGACP